MSSLSPLKLALCLAGISLSLLLPQPGWTQSTSATTDVNPLQDLDPQQNKNPFSSRDDGEAMTGIMDLIHRAQMGNIRSTGEYSAEQDQNLNNAAAQFRQRQLEMIRQNQPNPANSVQSPRVAQ